MPAFVEAVVATHRVSRALSDECFRPVGLHSVRLCCVSTGLVGSRWVSRGAVATGVRVAIVIGLRTKYLHASYAPHRSRRRPASAVIVLLAAPCRPLLTRDSIHLLNLSPKSTVRCHRRGLHQTSILPAFELRKVGISCMESPEAKPGKKKGRVLMSGAYWHPRIRYVVL
jgi:hypothetical protein